MSPALEMDTCLNICRLRPRGYVLKMRRKRTAAARSPEGINALPQACRSMYCTTETSKQDDILDDITQGPNYASKKTRKC